MFGINPYPLRILILRRRQNGFVPIFDKGRMETKKAKNNKKAIVQQYLKIKGQKAKIPLPETDFYQEIDGIPYLYLIQLDRNTFYPMHIENDVMVLKRPIYKDDLTKPIYSVENDQYVLDEKGEKVILGYEPQKNEEGEPIIEKHDNVAIGALDVMIDNGYIVKVPKMHMVKTYDIREVMASEQERDAVLYGKKGFLEQWGAIISFTLLGILIISLLYIAFKNLTPMFQQVVAAGQAVAQSNAQVADALRIIGQQFAGNGAALPTSPPF